MNRNNAHLFSGGHKGAEAEFSRAAKRWAIPETTFSFAVVRAGRIVDRNALPVR